MARIQDMTKGNPGKLIFFFALPLMLGNICQQLYTMVDTIIVGQGVGVQALASLGAADWLNWLILGISTGFSQGFSIMIAQRFGANDMEGLRKSVSMSYLLGGIIAIIATILSQLTALPILKLLKTPENILPGSLIYLRISFSGILIVMAYNVFASILRALGDGKTPLIAMLIASVINIILDMLFVFVFHWGIAGAAIATVVAQVFSGLFCLKAILKISFLKLKRSDWTLNQYMIKRLIQLGTPTAFQNIIISIGGMVVQYVINGFGFIFVAGFTATNKLYGLLEVASTSFGFSMATFTGQNLGAKQLTRIKSGVKTGAIMGIVTAALISCMMFILGEQIVSLFVSGEPNEIEQVIAVAKTYLMIMSALLPILYLLYIYRSALQGMGDTITPMLSGLIEFIMRVSVVLILPKIIGQSGVYYAEIAAWTGATILLMSTYYLKIRKLSQSIDYHI